MKPERYPGGRGGMTTFITKWEIKLLFLRNVTNAIIIEKVFPMGVQHVDFYESLIDFCVSV